MFVGAKDITVIASVWGLTAQDVLIPNEVLAAVPAHTIVAMVVV